MNWPVIGALAWLAAFWTLAAFGLVYVIGAVG